jgi:hypothetical protein
MISPTCSSQGLPGGIRAKPIWRWSEDNQSIFVYTRSEFAYKVYRLDRLTGKRSLLVEVTPSDRAGATGRRRGPGYAERKELCVFSQPAAFGVAVGGWSEIIPVTHHLITASGIPCRKSSSAFRSPLSE